MYDYLEDYDACVGLVTDLFKGTYDEVEYVKESELLNLFKYVTPDKWARFQVYKERKTGCYFVEFNFFGENEGYWKGKDLSAAIPLWLEFIKNCEK